MPERQPPRRGQSLAMPKGPKGEKRPADVVSNAVRIARIATGEEPEKLTDDGKDKAAVSLGRKGGKARAERLTEGERRNIAANAAKQRWAKREPQ